MQDNRDKLYDNLVKSGKVSESEIGNRDQFKSAIKDEASAAKFHDNLLKAGFSKEEIGDSKSFYNSIASDFKSSNVSPHVSQYVEGTGKNTKVFGMPYAVFQNLKPESKAYYYQEEQRKKAEAQANDIQQRAEGQYGAAVNSEIDKKNKFSTEHPILSAFANVASEGTGGQMNAIESSTPVMAAKAAINKAKDVKEVIDTSRRKANGTNALKELGRGFYDKAKKSGTWDFGISDMKENGALLSAAMKKEKGEPLNDSEKTLLESAALEALSDEKFMKDVGMPYRIGSGTAESASYMKDFLLSGGLQGLGKAAVGKFGTEAAEKTTGQIIKNAILRTAGDLVGAAGMSSTIHSGNVVGDALARKTGDVKFSQDKEGRAQFAGTGGGETTPKAIGKAFASNTINDFSEMLGEYFAPAIGKVGDVISSTKPFQALKATKVGEMLNKVSTSDWAKTVNDFEKNAQFHGTFGEYAEEVAGNAMNAAIVGDQSWSDVVDPGQNVETFLSVSLMSGIMSSSKAIGYRKPKLEAERKLSQAEDEANNIYGSQFGEIKSALENASVEDRKDYLSKVASSSMDEGKKKAIFNFVGRLTELEGMNEAEQKAEQEGSVPEGIERNKSDIYTGFEEAKKKVESLPQEELDYYEAHPEKLPESQNKDLIEDYLTAKSDFDGYLNHVSNKIQTAKENARKQVEGVANPEMNAIVRVSSKASEQPTHVVGGTLAFDDEGNVDERQSSPVIYYLDEEGKRKMAPPSMFSSLIDSTPIEDMASQAEQDAEQQIVEQEEAELPQEAPSLEIGSSITTSDGVTGEVTRFTPEGEAVISDGQHDYVVPSDNILSINGQSPTAPDAQRENIQEEPKNINTSVNDEENNILSENVGLNKSIPSDEQSNLSKETPAEQEEGTLPLDKDGNVDYKQISDPTIYAKALKKEFGEDALSIVEEDIANQQKQLSHAEKKGNAIEKARTKKRINQELSRLENIKGLLSPQKENETPHDIATDEEYADWAADNSDDPIELAGAYGVAKEQSSHENTLLPWQRELLGRKVNTNSFNRFGDRNKINGTFAKAWLRKDGEELDTLAQELSGFGNEVTENDIVDFMLSNPTNYVRTTSDLQKKLSGRFSEIASKEMGISVGGPESNTGKLYLELKKANQRLDQLTESQTKEVEDAILSDYKPEDNTKEGSYLDNLDDEQMAKLANIQDGYRQAIFNEESDNQNTEENDNQRESGGNFDVAGNGERPEGSTGEGSQSDIDTGITTESAEPERQNREDGITSSQSWENDNTIAQAENEINTNPSEAQKEAGNYKMGHVKIGGYDVTIENPKGSERKGIDNSGTPWSIKMNNSYGYFRGTKGKDGDHIDVFLGDNLNPEKVYVVDQVNPDGSFDEHKVMYGFNSEQEARDAYLANYEEGWTGLGNIIGVPKKIFDEWMSTGTKKQKPFSEYKIIRSEEDEHFKTLSSVTERLNNATGQNVSLYPDQKEVIEALVNDGVEKEVVDEIEATFTQALEDGTKFPGFFDSKTGKIYLCANQIKDEEELKRKYFHEATHAATNHNLTDEQLEYLYNTVGEDAIREYVPDYYFDSDLSETGLADEYLSYLAEDIVNFADNEESPVDIEDIDDYEERKQGAPIDPGVRQILIDNFNWIQNESGNDSGRSQQDNGGRQESHSSHDEENVGRGEGSLSEDGRVSTDKNSDERFEGRREENVVTSPHEGTNTTVNREEETGKPAGREEVSPNDSGNTGSSDTSNTGIRYRGSETTMDNVADRVYRLSASFGRIINGRKPSFRYSEESGKSEYTPNSFVTDFELEASTLIDTLNALKEDATDAAKEYIQGFIDRLNDQTEYYKKLDENGGVSNQDYKALYHRSVDSLNDLLRDLTSKPESKEQEAISRSVSELSDKLNTPVRLIKDLNEITDDNASLQKRTSKGWFDPETGEVVIILPNATGVADAQRTMLHEIAGHKGLRGLFGDKFDDAIDGIFKSLPDDIRKHISEQAISKYNYDIATATEEYLAEQAESGTDPSIWNKIISAIKELFRKAGIELEMSDNDIKYLLWRSRNNLENGTIEERMDKKMRDLDIRDKLFRKTPEEEKKSPILDSNALSKESMGEQIKIAQEAAELTDEEKKDFSAKLRNDRFREGWQDRMLPLRRFQELVSEHTGRKIEEFCDAYTNENTIASRSTYEIDQFKNDYLKPLVNAVVKLGDPELVKSYMKAKHGIERNKHMRDVAVERRQKQMDDHIQGIKNQLQQDLMSLRAKKGTTQADIDKFQKKIDQTVETAKKAAIKNLSNYAIKQQSVDYAGLTGLQHRLFKQEETDPLLEDEIVMFIEEFENDHDSKDVESLWNSVRRANTFSLNKQLSSGCIDKATKKQISEMYKYYIPLRAWSEETAGDFYDYFFKDEHDVVNNPLMKANGRKSESGDPLASIASMAESAVFIGNKNEMKQHLLSLVRNYPTNMATIAPVWYRNDGDVWQEVVPELTGDREEDLDTLERFNQQMEELEKSGLAKRVTKGLSLDVPIKKWQADQHAIKVKENGKDLVIYINGDPRVAQAVNGLNNVKPFDNKLVRTQGDIKRFMTQNFTTRNPAFVLSNLSRDMIYAMTMNAIREDAPYNLAFIKAIPEASSTITRYLAGKEGDGKYDKYFDEFLANGGETGFVALTSYEQYKKEIKREIDKANGTGKMSDAFHVIAKGLSGCNRWAEDMSRFSAYIASREEGRSIVRSVRDAKELSVNFNRKGSGAGGNWLADMSYFFLNAGIQGMYNFSHTFKNYPVRTSVAMGSWMMLGAMMPLMYNILSGGDDDYDKLPDYIRQNNIVIPFFGEDNFVTIPLPIELRAFFGVGDILSQFVGGKYKDRNAGADVLGKLLDATPRNFIEGSDKGENGLVGAAFVNLTPDAIKPFVDAYITNRSFTGRPIVKKNEYNTYIPEYRKVYKGTSQILVKSSQALNSMTGGDFATKGWADSPLLNPGAVEHLFFSYMGGVGKTILQTVKSTVGPLVGEEVALKDIPVVNRFGYQFDPAMPNSVVNERYQKNVKLLEESQSRDREYKRGLRQGLDLGDSYIEKKSDEEERRMMIVKAYKNQIDDIASLLQVADEGSSDKIKNEIADMKFKMLDELDKMDKK